MEEGEEHLSVVLLPREHVQLFCEKLVEAEECSNFS